MVALFKVAARLENVYARNVPAGGKDVQCQNQWSRNDYNVKYEVYIGYWDDQLISSE